MATQQQVKTIEEFRAMPEEFQGAVRKIVISHAVNELYGAQVFDEPAIALARGRWPCQRLPGAIGQQQWQQQWK